jgi:Yip1 domain
VINILVSPAKEWEVIKGETKTKNEVVLNYALPLIILAAITAFIGHAFLRRYHLPIGSSLLYAVYFIVAQLLSIYLTAFIMNVLAPSFGSKKNFDSAIKLVVYSYTASLVASIIANLSLFGVLGWIGIFGLYSIYLFWTGMGPMMETPADKKLGYLIVTALVLIAIWVVFSIVLAPLFFVTTAVAGM